MTTESNIAPIRYQKIKILSKLLRRAGFHEETSVAVLASCVKTEFSSQMLSCSTTARRVFRKNNLT